MKKHLKSTLEKLHKKKDRQRINVYFSESVYLEFKKLCKDISVSAVLEEWMREAIEEAKKK